MPLFILIIRQELLLLFNIEQIVGSKYLLRLVMYGIVIVYHPMIMAAGKIIIRRGMNVRRLC